jgi:UDP-glucose 4-epimerase
MTAIVTGGAGFIGSHVVDLLAERGERVVVIDDQRSGNHVNVRDNVNYYCRSIDDLGAWDFPDASVIYHLAGPVGPVGVITQAGRIASDILRDARIVRMACGLDATLVYVSTSEIYGPQPPGPIREDAPRVIVAGHSARMEYAAAKLAAETMLLNTPGLDVRIIRPFNVAGPRQRPDGGFVLPRFIRQAKAGEPLTVYAPGTQRRAFTHVLDIAEGIILAAERGYPGAIYNIGNPANECDILQLAEEVLEVTGSESAISIVDPVDLWGPAFREAPDKVPDAGRAVLELGWAPTRDRRQTIVDAAA